MSDAPDLAAEIAAVQRARAEYRVPRAQMSAADKSHLAAFARAVRVLEALAEEPTQEMIDAGDDYERKHQSGGINPGLGDVWNAMLAALLARAGGGG